ncbi:hypothetical protein LOTGIDRAFT_160597, partial [Lottia gigantea]
STSRPVTPLSRSILPIPSIPSCLLLFCPSSSECPVLEPYSNSYPILFLARRLLSDHSSTFTSTETKHEESAGSDDEDQENLDICVVESDEKPTPIRHSTPTPPEIDVGDEKSYLQEQGVYQPPRLSESPFEKQHIADKGEDSFEDQYPNSRSLDDSRASELSPRSHSLDNDTEHSQSEENQTLHKSERTDTKDSFERYDNDSHSDNEPPPTRREKLDYSPGTYHRSERERHFLKYRDLKDHERLLGKDTSPPNVTVMQPSVSHPMFPYLCAGSVFPNSSGGLPFPLNSALLNSSSYPHGHLTVPLLPGSPPELPHLPPTHLHSSNSGPMLGSHSLLSNSHLMNQSYQGLTSQLSMSHITSSHPLGPMFSPRSAPRFSPYTVPLTKTTMVTNSSPVSIPGGHYGLGESPRGGPLLSSPVSSTHIPSSPRKSPLPAHQQSPSTPNHGTDIRSIERMLNGLDRKPPIHDSNRCYSPDK